MQPWETQVYLMMVLLHDASSGPVMKVFFLATITTPALYTHVVLAIRVTAGPVSTNTDHLERTLRNGVERLEDGLPGWMNSAERNRRMIRIDQACGALLHRCCGSAS